MKLTPAVGWKAFFRELWKEISEDNVFNGAAALAYYLTLAIFPALILLLSLVPFLPVEQVDVAIMDMLKQALPDEAATMLQGVVEGLANNRKEELLSLGVLGTLWAASSGTYAIMQQLNITYDVKEGRSFLKSRLVAVGLTLMTGTLIIVSFLLIILGGKIQSWLASAIGWESALLMAFAILRLAIIVTAVLMAFAFAYYFGPDVQQQFRFVTPGSAMGSLVLIGASLGFRAYVTNFGNYNATYGSIGAVIILMLWLYLSGLVLLLGSEINALIEHHLQEGKAKGEKAPGAKAAA